MEPTKERPDDPDQVFRWMQDQYPQWSQPRIGRTTRS
jgi:hypothetical protein